MEWSLRYPSYPNVFVACNSTRAFHDLSTLIGAIYPNESKQLLYLPNIYPTVLITTSCPKPEDNFLDVACFGAIRPLKNQLMQAIAAIAFAEQIGKTLRFHINTVTGGPTGSAILKNLVSLFKLLPNLQLIQHPWYPHDQFLELLATMDLGLQVSFSETFNIVSADMVCVGLPIVTSSEVIWAPPVVFANPTDCKDIIGTMTTVWGGRENRRINDVVPQSQKALNSYSGSALNYWLMGINNLL
jgi:hypothetical protein